jgi:hypothetical protein
MGGDLKALAEFAIKLTAQAPIRRRLREKIDYCRRKKKELRQVNFSLDRTTTFVVESASLVVDIRGAVDRREDYEKVDALRDGDHGRAVGDRPSIDARDSRTAAQA